MILEIWFIYLKNYFMASTSIRFVILSKNNSYCITQRRKSSRRTQQKISKSRIYLLWQSGLYQRCYTVIPLYKHWLLCIGNLLKVYMCVDYTKGTCMVDLPVVDVRIILKSQKLSKHDDLNLLNIVTYIYICI